MTFLCHPRRVNYWLTQWVGGTSFVVQLKCQGFETRHIRFALKTPRMKLKNSNLFLHRAILHHFQIFICRKKFHKFFFPPKF